MDDYKKYLASEVLSEGRLVTYRLLSRALEVHVHTAKQHVKNRPIKHPFYDILTPVGRMLFEFRESQNSQKLDSVHATYLVYGEKHDDIANGDEDVEMSSPGADAESISEPTRALTLNLVEEDKLKDALSLYKTVLSIQVYSLGPHPTKDLQLLSEANYGLSKHLSGPISPEAIKACGGILNSNVKRKDRKGPKPVSTINTTKPEPPAPKPMPVKSSVGSQLKNKASESPSSSQGASTPSGEKLGSSDTKARSGGIMQSFAKAAASTPKPKQEKVPQPAGELAAKTRPTAMVSDDDGEEDDHSGILSRPRASGDGTAARKAREEREAELKRMMEEDDEGEEETPNSPDEELEETPPGPEETETKDAEEKGGQEQGGTSDLVSSSGDGRKRGKRKVIKKRQIQDDEGYFVTVRETAWESFSEDEAPQPKKATPPAAPSTGGSSKAKKPAPKGQGSIMSFFAKKS